MFRNLTLQVGHTVFQRQPEFERVGMLLEPAGHRSALRGFCREWPRRMEPSDSQRREASSILSNRSPKPLPKKKAGVMVLNPSAPIRFVPGAGEVGIDAYGKDRLAHRVHAELILGADRENCRSHRLWVRGPA